MWALYIVMGLVMVGIGVWLIIGREKKLGIVVLVCGIAVCLLIVLFDTPSESSRKQKVKVDTKTSFTEMYNESKKNEARANDEYSGKRYQVTAKINEISDGGVLTPDTVTLTLEKAINGTHVFFYASFDKDQRETLKKYNKGDRITFQGEYRTIGSWKKCIVVSKK